MAPAQLTCSARDINVKHIVRPKTFIASFHVILQCTKQKVHSENVRNEKMLEMPENKAEISQMLGIHGNPEGGRMEMLHHETMML